MEDEEDSSDHEGNPNPKLTGETFDIGHADMLGMIGDTWMNNVEQVKAQIKQNLDAVEDLAGELEGAFEEYANDPKSRQMAYSQPDCYLDCTLVAESRDRLRFFPVWSDYNPGHSSAPIISLKSEDGRLTGLGVSFLAPVRTVAIEGGLRTGQYPSIPTSKSWQDIVEETLSPLSQHCAVELSEFIDQPDSLAKQQALHDKLTAMSSFLMLRYHEYQATVDDFQAEPNADQCLKEYLTHTSSWRFATEGGDDIRLEASALSRKEFEDQRAAKESVRTIEHDMRLLSV